MPRTNIELLSFGDRVPVGKYRPFSRFAGALNFVRSRHRPGLAGPVLVCVVDQAKGAGPLNIVVRGPLAAVPSLEVRPDHVLLGDAAFRITARYDSRLILEGPLSEDSLRRNLAAFEDALLADAPPQSAANLVRRRAEPSFMSRLSDDLRSGIRSLEEGRLLDGARLLKGRGFGLTPSGDDFLAGFMLGLRALQTAYGSDFSREIRTLRRAARSRNLFSEAFLRCAAEGRFFARAKSLALALFQGREDEVRRASARLASVGACSGSDIGAGLLCALKRHCPSRQEVEA